MQSQVAKLLFYHKKKKKKKKKNFCVPKNVRNIRGDFKAIYQTLWNYVNLLD